MSGDYANYDTCTQVSALCPVAATTYGYYPILSVNLFFTVLFGILLVLQIPITIRTKTWTYAIGLGIGTIFEFVGYIGRVLMHYNPWNQSAFELQIVALILAPSFIAASIYLTLKHMVNHYGPEHSRLKPNLYPWIFVGCDFGSIVLQAIGGGVAASAGGSGAEKLLKAGDDLIVAGIAFQVATMVVCGVLVGDYVVRLRRARRSAGVGGIITAKSTTTTPNDSEEEKGTSDSRPSAQSTTPPPPPKSTTTQLKMFWISVVFAYFTVLIRCIYRLPEMVGGWGNPRMRRETEFLILDGMMIALATISLTLIHPGFCFDEMVKGKKTRRPEEVTQA